MMLIVTGLGKTRRMDEWWDKHKTDGEIRAMSFNKYACITVLQGEDEEHEQKYKDSAQTVKELLVEFSERLETPLEGYCPDDANQWFVSMGKRTMNFLLPGQRRSLKQEALAKVLQEGNKLSEVQASDLAGQFFDEHPM
ncbi:hypothetical protein J3R82DRAFT_6856 [Butyriboletus roseoflavus]|nr:hypothetical protein J3R82DRAFT_6856 [Butyriboletus roseoflavus]